MFLLLIFCFAFITHSNCARDTTCAEDQKHFADVCFTPKPTKSFDYRWFVESQPEGGWYMNTGNDVWRHHFSEILQGKLLSLHDDYNKTCFRLKLTPLDSKILDSKVAGFGNLEATWKCKLSKDNEMVFLCDGISEGPSKYHENFSVYVAYSDKKNYFEIAIACFPNGQAGYLVRSTTPTLSEDLHDLIREKVNEFGFAYEDHVTMYDGSC